MDFTQFHPTSKPIIKGRIPGRKSRWMLAQQAGVEAASMTYPVYLPVAFTKGKGCCLMDSDGNTLMDLFSGAGALSFGHCFEPILRVACEQMRQLTHCLDFATPAKMRFIESFERVVPRHLRGDYRVLFCGPSGADAVEAGVKIARRTTGRHHILTVSDGYHGMTLETMRLSGMNRHRIPNLMHRDSVPQIPAEFAYECGNGGEDSLKSASFFEEMTARVLSACELSPSDLAAVLVEPILGEGGSRVMRRTFATFINSFCKRNGIVLISDEIQAGIGRSGLFWSCDYVGLMPDIVLVSKGITGIGLPFAFVLLAGNCDSLRTGDHVGTFRGFQPGMAAATKVLQLFREYDILGRVQRLDALVRNRLTDLAAKSRLSLNVSGVGLIWGIKLASKSPGGARRAQKCLLKKGILVEVGGREAEVVRLLPALIVTEQILQNCLDIMEDVLQ